MRTIDIGVEFSAVLTNRDHRQRDGKHTAIEFRQDYLSELDTEAAWIDDSQAVILDFSKVTKMGPSWANEALAYFTKYASPDRIIKKISFINISRVKKAIILQELESGYSR